MGNTRIFLEQIDQSGAQTNDLMLWNGSLWTHGSLPNSSVSLAQMANLSANTIVGNNTGVSAAPVALTTSQVTAMLAAFGGANGTVAGSKGLVPAPAATDNVKFLRGDGTWVANSAAWGSITGTLSNQTDLNTALTGKLDTSHAGSGGSAHALVISGGAAGFMTGSDKAKLDGISSGATANSTDSFLLDRGNHTGTESITTNTFSATARLAGRITAGSGTAEELTGTQATTLLDVATETIKGLMSATDKTKLDGVATGATANSPDSTLLNRANHTGTQAAATINFANSSRFLARITTGAGTGEEITGTQATTLLDLASGTLKGLMSSSDYTKLSGVAAGATANQTDAYLLSRANHTGTQAWTTITSTPTTISGYGITDAVSSSQLGAANGIATLGSDSKIPSSQLPAIAITSTYVVASQAAQLALTTQEGDLAVRTDLSETFINNGGTSGTMSDWTQLLSPTAGVSSVNGMTGAITLTKTDVGLGNVDNTADTDKPVSTAQQTALNLKVDSSSHVGLGGSVHAVVVSGGAAGFMTGSDKAKLDGVASGATANQTDAYLLSRSNHTGTQAITTNTFSTSSVVAGRITAGTGIVEELTGTQVTSLLDVVNTTTKGLAPASGGGTANFLRADGTWATPPNTGVWGSITGTLSSQTDLQNALNAKANLSGATFTGPLTTVASSTSAAGFNIPAGTAPTSPANGDIWQNASNQLVVRLNATNQTVATLSVTQTFSGNNTFSGSNTFSAAQFFTLATATTLANNPALRTGAVASTNLVFDTTSVQARNNGAAATLNLNPLGGTVVAGGAISATNLSGTNTGDQTITLTGDVTGSGTGSFAATIAAGSVTLAKLSGLSQGGRLYGSAVGSTAAAEISVGTGLTIGTSTLRLTNANNNTIKGNVSGSAAAPVDLTGTQVTAILDTVVGDTGTGGTKGLVPAPGAGDAAANKFLKADGTWAAASQQGFSPITATGTGASQGITLPGTYTEAQVLVFINGIYQTPITDYTISGTTLTLTTPSSGDAITIINPGTGPQGPAGSGSLWGGIGGTLSNQTDLQTALNAKANSSSLAAIATSGSGADLTANSVTLAKLATQATATILGNTSGSTAAPSALTTTQVTAMLNAVVGDSGSGGTKGLVPAPATGDAAAGKFLKADGTWAAPAGGSAINYGKLAVMSVSSFSM